MAKAKRKPMPTLRDELTEMCMAGKPADRIGTAFYFVSHTTGKDRPMLDFVSTVTGIVRSSKEDGILLMIAPIHYTMQATETESRARTPFEEFVLERLDDLSRTITHLMFMPGDKPGVCYPNGWIKEVGTLSWC